LAHGKKHDESGLEFHRECSWFWWVDTSLLANIVRTTMLCVICFVLAKILACSPEWAKRHFVRHRSANRFVARKHSLADSLLEKAPEDHIDVIGLSGLIGPSNDELQRSFFEEAVKRPSLLLVAT
jgi:hypothetical protein